MRLSLLSAAALLAAGCALKPPPRPAAAPALGIPTAQANVPATAPAPVPPRANFFLIVSEIVAQPADDIGSYVKVFVDGAPAGETQIAARSQEKTWGAALPSGNHLFRFQKWDLPDTGDWTTLDPEYQPPERFIRIKDEQKTVVRLRFYDNGLKNALEIERQSLPPQP